MSELEKLSSDGLVDLYYGDESHVCSEGYVPYGWQFPDEEVAVYSQKGFRVNMFGLISRKNECFWSSTQENINSKFSVDFLETFSFQITKTTCIVVDNASIHTSKLVQERIIYWQKRGLYLFFLPPYSPHLNIAEKVWKIMKGNWIRPEDYIENDQIAYAVNRCLANIGENLNINFSPFNIN